MPVYFGYSTLTSSPRKCKDSWLFPLLWFLQLINKIALYQGSILEDYFSSCRSLKYIPFDSTSVITAQDTQSTPRDEIAKTKKNPSPLKKTPKHQNTTTTSPIYEITGLRNLSIMQLLLRMKRLCQGTRNEMYQGQSEKVVHIISSTHDRTGVIPDHERGTQTLESCKA